MATIGATAITYLDYQSRLDPDNKIAKIIELSSKRNEILLDFKVKEGNLPIGHQAVIRTGLPAVAWRMLNYGVPQSKSITQKVIDTCGMLESYSEVDVDIAKINGNSAEFRLGEDASFLEAMNQEMATGIFYHSQVTAPEKITGFGPRYPSPGQAPASWDPEKTAFNMVNAASATDGTDNFSMWLVVWGDNTVHGIVPQGSEGGFMHEDLGQNTNIDANGLKYEVLRSHYQWKIGLHVKDWRYVVRICNIDLSKLIAGGVVDLFGAMIDAYYKIPSLGMGSAAFYASPVVLAWLQKQAAAKSNVIQSTKDPVGRPVIQFMDIPIRRCDALVQESPIAFS
jgi:hypothetical protein